MTKILIEEPVFSASAKIGVIDVLNLFADISYKFLPTSSITSEDIMCCDIFITVRGSEYLTYSVVSAAKNAGRFIMYFLDDDLLNVPIGDAVSKTYYDVQVKNYLPKILSLSDVLWCVNPKVGNDYKKFLRNGRVVVSSVPVLLPQVNALTGFHKDDKVTRFLYAGSKSHSDNVCRIISPALQKIYDEYKDNVHFCFIGADPKLNFVEFNPFFDDYDEYRSFVLSRHFDYGIAVVGEDEFYQSKYFNKYIEYTQLGCIGIYSDLPPYSTVIKNRENGYMYNNTSSGLYDVLKMLVSSEASSKVFENAYNDISIHNSSEFVHGNIAEEIPELCAFSAPEISADKIKIENRCFQAYVFYLRLIFAQYTLTTAISICITKVICRFIKKANCLKNILLKKRHKKIKYPFCKNLK